VGTGVGYVLTSPTTTCPNRSLVNFRTQSNPNSNSVWCLFRSLLLLSDKATREAIFLLALDPAASPPRGPYARRRRRGCRVWRPDLYSSRLGLIFSASIWLPCFFSALAVKLEGINNIPPDLSSTWWMSPVLGKDLGGLFVWCLGRSVVAAATLLLWPFVSLSPRPPGGCRLRLR
jgi:hypothetical protein